MKKWLKLIFGCVVVLAALGAGGFLYWKFTHPVVNPVVIDAVLREADELSVSELEFNGYCQFKDTGLLFMRGDFLMTYTAVARYGINLSGVHSKVDNKDKIVSVKIPKAKILDVKVTKQSYYNQGFAPFNPDSKEDADKARLKVENDARKNPAVLSSLKYANKRSVALISTLIGQSLPKGWKTQVEVQ